MDKKVKRTWHYLLSPTAFDMRCDKCWSGELDDETGTNITWSEWQGLIWCYDCEIDTKGFGGIFDGPVPIRAAYMMGLIFDRFNMKTNGIELYNIKTCDWDTVEKAAKNLLEGEDYDIYGDITRRAGQESFYTPLYEMVEKLRTVILATDKR